MKIYVDRDERYPDYTYSTEEEITKFGRVIEITDEELALINKAQKLYEKAQDILSRAWQK